MEPKQIGTPHTSFRTQEIARYSHYPQSITGEGRKAFPFFRPNPAP